jgi:hypothetical protein
MEIPPTEAPIEPPYHGTGISVELRNTSPVPVGHVYLSVSGSGDAGQDLLEGEPLAPSETITVSDIPFGIYDLRAESADNAAIDTTYMQILDGLTVWEIVGGDGSGWLPGTIQWGVDARASSQFSDPDWSARQATGLPDTSTCRDAETAWASETLGRVEWLEIAYATPVIPLRIAIIETHYPGLITLVEVGGVDGEFYQVWQGEVDPSDRCPRVLSIEVSGVETPVNRVRIQIDQTSGWDWNEIDAVMLFGE